MSKNEQKVKNFLVLSRNHVEISEFQTCTALAFLLVEMQPFNLREFWLEIWNPRVEIFTMDYWKWIYDHSFKVKIVREV